MKQMTNFTEFFKQFGNLLKQMATSLDSMDIVVVSKASYGS